MITDNSIALHCPTCGFRKPLPNLPPNYDPKGVFVRTENFIISLMSDVTVPHVIEDQVVLDTTLLFLQQLETNAGNVGDEATWVWDVYPGTNQFSPVRTVNFTHNATFSAATAGNIFILDGADRLLNHPFVTVEFEDRLALDNLTATWMFHGHHIFVCDQLAYLCILTRSVLDSSDIGVVCFLIEHNPGFELSLVEVNSFGPYSVYLGSNQPLVLCAIDGVPGRSPNTIYIEDNDGIIRNKRVVAINLETQAVQTILFPEDLHFGPLDFTASAWVVLNSENCHTG